MAIPYLRRHETRNTLATSSLILLTWSHAALAGPPYVTDDPEPTDTGHWEDYAFVTGTQLPGQSQGQLGVELNYGGATDLQLSASVPMDYIDAARYRLGAGDLQLSAKYRFLHQSEDSALPDVAFFPQANIPTAGRGFGSERLSWFLPLWAEKDFGDWSVFGGGGLEINPGTGNRDYGLVGLAVTRAATEALALGIEIYHLTPQTIGGGSFTALGFGAVYRLNERFALLASGGPGLQGATQSGQSQFYAALELNY